MQRCRGRYSDGRHCVAHPFNANASEKVLVGARADKLQHLSAYFDRRLVSLAMNVRPYQRLISDVPLHLYSSADSAGTTRRTALSHAQTSRRL